MSVQDDGELIFTWKTTSPLVRNNRKVVVPDSPGKSVSPYHHFLFYGGFPYGF